MTCKNEAFDFENYTKIQLVEFYEIIGRAAYIKFNGSDYGGEPL